MPHCNNRQRRGLFSNKTTYNFSSPDEDELVNGALFFGYFFLDRDEKNYILIKLPDGSIKKYKLLNVIEFDSARKKNVGNRPGIQFNFAY
jgi:magnesium-transporting ATPase (P-type)